MSNRENEGAGTMMNPPHLGELIRESVDDSRMERDGDGGASGLRTRTLSRSLNGRAGPELHQNENGSTAGTALIRSSIAYVVSPG